MKKVKYLIKNSTLSINNYLKRQDKSVIVSLASAVIIVTILLVSAVSYIYIDNSNRKKAEEELIARQELYDRLQKQELEDNFVEDGAKEDSNSKKREIILEPSGKKEYPGGANIEATDYVADPCTEISPFDMNPVNVNVYNVDASVRKLDDSSYGFELNIAIDSLKRYAKAVENGDLMALGIFTGNLNGIGSTSWAKSTDKYEKQYEAGQISKDEQYKLESEWSNNARAIREKRHNDWVRYVNVAKENYLKSTVRVKDTSCFDKSIESSRKLRDLDY